MNGPRFRKPGVRQKLVFQVKAPVDAVSRAHGQPISFLIADCAALLVQFKKKFGITIHNAKLFTQSCYEVFEDFCYGGTNEAEWSIMLSALQKIANKPAQKVGLSSKWRCTDLRKHSAPSIAL